MAKVKSGGIRNLIGTLGGNVYYMRSGENVAREKAAFVTNPRTTSQMNQRVRLANLVNFYRANRGWMFKGAFENKPAKWSDYNAFVSRNIEASDIALTKAEANVGACVMDAYKVTDGSLTPLTYSYSSGKFSVAVAGLAASTETMGALSQALIDANLGIQAGDQLSIIFMVNKRDANDIPKLQVYAVEAIINTADTRDIPEVLFSPAFAANAGAGVINITPTANSGSAFGLAVIISRTTANGIKVSPQFVSISDPTFIEGYSSETQYQKAFDSYGDSEAYFLDSRTAVAGDSNSSGGDPSEGGSGSGDPGDVTP